MPSLYNPSQTTVADVQTTFLTMTDNAVVAMVGDCAAGLRTQWLEIAMDLGVFDFTDEVAARGTVKRSSACIEGLMKILEHTESITLTHDPEFGALPIPIASHTLSKDAKGLGPFVAQLVDRLIKDREGVVSTYIFDFADTMQAPQGQTDVDHDQSAKAVLKEANRSLATLMALAAALNLPETVRSLRWSTPTAHQEGLPSHWLGDAFEAERTGPAKRLDVAPAFFAVFYSNTEALKAFAPKPKPQKKEGGTLEKILPMFLEDMGKDPMMQHDLVLRHDALAMLNHWFPSCAPNTLALSWRERLDPDKPARHDDMTGLNLLACKALYRYPNKENPFAPQIPAFEAIGAFDHVPGVTIVEAVENGHPAYVERFKGKVPWNERKFAVAMETLLMKTVEAAGNHTPRNDAEAAMVALMRLAVEDGRQDRFFQTQVITNKAMADFLGESIVQPICSLIENKFNKVLLGFLENGLSPTSPMAAHALSPLDFAHAVDARDAINMMRSFVARNSAHNILNEMDATPFSPKAKPC